MNSTYSITLFLCILLCACSTQDRNRKQACLTDWSQVGEEDAFSGARQTAINIHVKTCPMTEIISDVDQYKIGYARGLINFCTAENGYRVGTQGYNYQHICPKNTENNFLQDYKDGREIFDIHTELNHLHWQIDSAVSDIQRFNQEIESTESAILRLSASQDDTLSALRNLNATDPNYETKKRDLSSTNENYQRDIERKRSEISSNKKNIADKEYSLSYFRAQLYPVEQKILQVELKNEKKYSAPKQAEPLNTTPKT
jgi:hypothetical protein